MAPTLVCFVSCVIGAALVVPLLVLLVLELVLVVVVLIKKTAISVKPFIAATNSGVHSLALASRVSAP